MKITLAKKQSKERMLPFLYVYENDCGTYIKFNSFCRIKKGIKLKKGRYEVARLFLDEKKIKEFKKSFKNVDTSTVFKFSGDKKDPNERLRKREIILKRRQANGKKQKFKI